MTTLFHAIADGSDRLRRGEDALIWRMRAEGRDWPDIEAAMLERRAKWRAQGEAMLLRRHAHHWREEYRRERGLAGEMRRG